MEEFLTESYPSSEDDIVNFDLSFKNGSIDVDSVTRFEMTWRHYDRLWAEAQAELDSILKHEDPLDVPAEIVPERAIVVQRASKMYLQYINVTNKIIKCYNNIAHPQKRRFLRKVVDLCICRVLEFKHELVSLENSEFHFLDHMLLSMGMLPKDMDLEIPEYFRDQTDEETERRKIVTHYLNILEEKGEGKYIVTEEMKFAKTAMVYLRLIQTHELARQARETFSEHQQSYLVKEVGRRKEASKKKKSSIPRPKAATIIQRSWRIYRLRKSLKQEFASEMNLLKMLPRTRKSLVSEMEEDRLRIIKRNEEEYQKTKSMLKTEMLTYRVPEMMEELEDEIRCYFRDYLLLYGKYPEFPSEEDGGSTKMFEISVKLDSDEAEMKDKDDTKSELQTDTKSVTESQSSKTTKSSKDSKSNKSESQKSDVPEGYFLKPSKCLGDLISLQEEYKTIWLTKEQNGLEHFDHDLLKDEVRKEMELVVRTTVDAKMRLELEKLTEALQKVSKKKSKAKKGKKDKKGKGKKIKQEKDLTPNRTLDSLIEELVSEGIIISYPKFKLYDFIGDYNYTGSAQHLSGNPKWDPVPCLGDVRRVINEYCILPMGSQEIHSRGVFVKSLLVAGPKGVGKKSLIYAICNELNATLINLSAENIEGKYPDKEGKEMLLHLVLKVGRLLQPTIIYIKDAENYFYKKKPASCTLSDPGRLKKDIPKLLKSIRNEDRIMICGTTVLPFDVDLKGLKSVYNKTICIFKPDYNCRRNIWREMIIRNGGVLTNNLDITVLCTVSDGFTGAAIESSVKQTLTNRRLAYQKKIPLNAADFLPEIANHVPVYEEENEAYKLWLEKLPLRKKRLTLLESERDEEEDVDTSEEED